LPAQLSMLNMPSKKNLTTYLSDRMEHIRLAMVVPIRPNAQVHLISMLVSLKRFRNAKDGIGRAERHGTPRAEALSHYGCMWLRNSGKTQRAKQTHDSSGKAAGAIWINGKITATVNFWNVEANIR